MVRSERCISSHHRTQQQTGSRQELHRRQRFCAAKKPNESDFKLIVSSSTHLSRCIERERIGKGLCWKGGPGMRDPQPRTGSSEDLLGNLKDLCQFNRQQDA